MDSEEQRSHCDMDVYPRSRAERETQTKLEFPILMATIRHEGREAFQLSYQKQMSSARQDSWVFHRVM